MMSKLNARKPGKPSPLRPLKILVEKHPDGYAAYPPGLKGVVVGQGNSYAEAMADVKSAIQFHRETFGDTVLDIDSPMLEVFVAETEIMGDGQ